MKQIQSTNNDKIKQLIRWGLKNNERKKSGLFLVEGVQENNFALNNAYESLEFYICPDIFQGDYPKGEVIEVGALVYEKIAYRAHSEGIIGVYKEKKQDLESHQFSNTAGVIILESIEKPGNLGAILRSAEAFGIEAVIVTQPKTDFYNPNVIRSSVGCLFGMNFFSETNQKAHDVLKEKSFCFYLTHMHRSSKNLFEANFNEKSVIVFGTEHNGISDFWLDKGENILIPMEGAVDSLNLSNAVAISAYEMLKQKKTTP